MMENHTNTHAALVRHLVQIEEDVVTLAQIVASQPLQRKEEIESLLSEITALAIRSRKKAVEMEAVAVQQRVGSEEAVVTAQEIRELLEAFA